MTKQVRVFKKGLWKRAMTSTRTKKFVFYTLFALVAFSFSENTVFAATDAKTIVTNLGKEVFKMLKYVGYILAIWGAGSFVLALKNEDADAKARAIMLLVAAILLFSVETIFNSLGITI